MKKPNNYDLTPAGNYTPIELGGHKLVIKQVSEKKSKTGKDMIVVLFDTDNSDTQPHFFMDMYKDDMRPEKKWPNQATQYIMLEDQEGNCTRSYKTFITCVEHSNPGFKVNWEGSLDQFKNKKIGGVFGEVEDDYTGQIKVKRQFRWFVSIDKVDDAPIPDKKLLPNKGSVNSNLPQPGSDGFMDIPDGIDEEIPFN